MTKERFAGYMDDEIDERVFNNTDDSYSPGLEDESWRLDGPELESDENTQEQRTEEKETLENVMRVLNCLCTC